MERVYSTHEKDELCIQNFSRKNPKGRDRREDIAVGGG
jgi:hypothetical protein